MYFVKTKIVTYMFVYVCKRINMKKKKKKLKKKKKKKKKINMYISLSKEANALKSPLELSYKLTYINTNFHKASNIICCLNIV